MLKSAEVIPTVYGKHIRKKLAHNVSTFLRFLEENFLKKFLAK